MSFSPNYNYSYPLTPSQNQLQYNEPQHFMSNQVSFTGVQYPISNQVPYTPPQYIENKGLSAPSGYIHPSPFPTASPPQFYNSAPDGSPQVDNLGQIGWKLIQDYNTPPSYNFPDLNLNLNLIQRQMEYWRY